MRKNNKIAVFVLAFSLLFGAFTISLALDETAPTVDVKFENTGDTVLDGETVRPVYKMLVSAEGTSTSGIKLLSTVISMDSKVIKPVKIGSTYTIANIVDGTKLDSCFDVTGTYGYKKYYSITGQGWKKIEDRIAYDYTVFTEAELDPTENKTSPMYEFYFTIVGTLYKGCIKVETDDSVGSFLDKFYPTDPTQRLGMIIQLENDDHKYVYSKDEKEIDYEIVYPNYMEADKVSSIAITTPPTKTIYVEGQGFDPAGMVVTATYADDTTAAVTGYTIAPSGALGGADTTVTVSYEDPFDEAVYTATQDIAIKKLIKEGDFTFDLADKIYQAATWKPSVTSSTLTEGTDYSVAYSDNTNVGTATITVTGMGDYTGEVVKTFEIIQADATVTIDATAQLYVGGKTKAIVPNYSVGGVTPTYAYQTSDDEIVTVDGNGVMAAVSEGTATITVTATDPAGNYKAATDEMTVTVSDKMDVSGSITFAVPSGVTYAGTEYVIGNVFVNAIFGGTTDGSGTIKYQYGGSTYNNLAEITEKVENAGTYAVTAIYEDDSQYGAKAVSFIINKAAITVTPNELSKTYGDGDPVLTYTVIGKPDVGVDVKGNLSRAAGEDAGTYSIGAGTVTNESNSNYDITFTAEKLFTINGKNLGAADLEYQGDSITKEYDGNTTAVLPSNGEIIVKSNSLVGSDASPVITVKSSVYDNSNVGLASKVTFTVGALTGNYVLADDTTLEAGASITQKDIGEATVTLTDASKPYNGNAQTTTVASVVLDSATLDAATDYDVTLAPSLTDVGDATYKVEGKGNYTGSATATFKITKADTTITITDVLGSLDKAYDGNPVNDPAVNPSIAGAVSFKHYTDAAANNELSTGPIDAGTYYVKAFLGGTNNYNGAESTAFAYTITQKELGAVTLETPVGFYVAKVYDGTTNSGTRSGDSLIVSTGIGAETLDVNITATGSYDTKDVDTNKAVALGVGSTLSDRLGKASNYTTGAAFPTTFNFTGASITAAGYTVTVAETIDVKIESPVSALPAASTTGVGTEKPAGSLDWYSDSNRTTKMTDNALKALALGTHNLYWKFTTTDGNYTAAPKTGTTAVTIVEGDPQYVVINGKPDTVTYGDGGFSLTTTVTTTGDAPVVGGGTITWASSDSEVASVDSTGKVTVKKAGTTTITASAAAVAGAYAAGSADWELTINQKEITPSAGTFKMEKVYDGTTEPGIPNGTLGHSGVLAADVGQINVIPVETDYLSKDVGDSNVDLNIAITGNPAKTINYKLASATVSVPCSITARDITAVSVTGITKTYDGSTGAGNAVIIGEAELAGKVEGDDLDIGLTVASFSAADVATENKTASITLGALTGADLGNYNLTATSPITASATIVPADITGLQTAAPTDGILANHTGNVDASALKAHMTLPDTVTVEYGTSGTETLPITWANSTEAFNIKGGTYTYKGTVANGTNFNAYDTTLDAVLTVTPVKITGIATVPGALTLAKADVTGAGNMVALGFPATVTLSFDNTVADEDIGSEWDTTLAELKALADTVTADEDKTGTVTLKNTNFPAWATMTGDMPFTAVSITNKLVIDAADITFANATITFGDVLSQVATVDGAKYPGATMAYLYTGAGTTTYGPSATPPVNAGTYTVVATVENATHKGIKSATLTINPKTLTTVTVSPITDQTYTGSLITPAYSVTGDSIVLISDIDYTGAFTSNTDVGAAALAVTCKGNYAGTVTVNFNIVKATPTISFTNTNQTLTSAGNNITGVVATLDPPSDGASATVYYWVVVTPKAPCNVIHDEGCASLESGKTIADCDCLQNHKTHSGSCGYVADDVYGWDTTVPQKAGTYKIYGYTAGDANLNPVNTSAPNADDVATTLIVSPYSSGSSTGGTTPPVTSPVVNPPTTTGTTTTVTTTVTPTITGTTAKAAVKAEDIAKAVDSAVKAAADSGTRANVTVKVDAPPEAKKVEVSLPAKSVESLIEKDDNATMTIESKVATIEFDNKALAAIEDSAKGSDIIIVAEDKDKKELTDEQKSLVGDRPVIDLSVLSGGKKISDFKGGSATVNIPYTLAEGEEPDGIVIWYLADNGKLEKKECVYDPVTKMATFVADHFSQYVLAYFPFTDLKGGEWYYENAVYAYTNGLISGIEKDKFDPTGKTTRAMVVTILWRLEGQPTAAAGTFKDVATGTWYTDAINWASANGIVSGYSDSKFGPNDTVTREQMAAIIYNYGTYNKYNMTGKAELAAFADAGKVSAWAEAPVQWAVEKGIISGTGKGLDPKGSAQRAQVAAILQRFIENTK